MDMILLVLIAIIGFTYFGQNVPNVFKDNKQLLLGVLVGVLLQKYTGELVEGNSFFHKLGCNTLFYGAPGCPGYDPIQCTNHNNASCPK